MHKTVLHRTGVPDGFLVLLLMLFPCPLRAAEPQQELMHNMCVYRFAENHEDIVMSKVPAIPGGRFLQTGGWKGRPLDLDTAEEGWGWEIDKISEAYASVFTDENSVVFFHWNIYKNHDTWYIQLRSRDGIGYSIWRVNCSEAHFEDPLVGYHIQPIVLGDNYFRRVVVTTKGYLILTNRYGTEIQVPPSHLCNASTYFNPY